MKQSLLLTFALLAAHASFGQGTINFGNNFSGRFRAPIYGVEPDGVPQHGQSDLGIPAGATPYTAPLVQGTDWSVALYAGPTSVVNAGDLMLITTTTFRTAAADVLPAGLFHTQFDLVIPGVPAGERAKFQIRAWYNYGGSVNEWGMMLPSAASEMVLSDRLGGFTGTELLLSPDTTGWSSFAFYLPEPSTWALAACGALAVLVGRFKRRS